MTQTAANSPKRVVLIKPGDTLLIGNVGEIQETWISVISALTAAGFDHTVVFGGDIDIDSIEGGTK